ncbi:MAG: hypothetical protein HN981_01950 [Candidatus Pacebacteria bacterium]|jgi:hypothetical protein|nr:hypothetical protein [Candidatus Paceibacterota bacterium]MBT4652769.1 hypothetical protein [Candidatus Paceibacterota bacterium]MBT6755926.1 hypothetical protein [Candidatus Paceibacterota bacterium]MBT6921139.1 hypothetical protein [Candidatus Paceibacterota bacterium]
MGLIEMEKYPNRTYSISRRGVSLELGEKKHKNQKVKKRKEKEKDRSGKRKKDRKKKRGGNDGFRR